MRKINTLLLFAFLLHTSCIFGDDEGFEVFLSKYQNIYQDLVIGEEIYEVGSDLCEPRYELIKPILDNFQKPFSVFDLGAAQGYFSFRIANDFPESSCVMVEDNNTAYYAHHGNMLYDLCLLNSHLKNIFFLKKRMNLSDLKFLNINAHFDFVFAFLVVHLMHETLQEQIKIVDALLDLGDNVIIEIANDVGVIHTTYVEYLSSKIDCKYLGEVKRHKDLQSTSTGKLYWFKRKPSTAERDVKVPLSRDVFYKSGGIYPLL